MLQHSQATGDLAVAHVYWKAIGCVAVVGCFDATGCLACRLRRSDGEYRTGYSGDRAQGTACVDHRGVGDRRSNRTSCLDHRVGKWDCHLSVGYVDRWTLRLLGQTQWRMRLRGHAPWPCTVQLCVAASASFLTTAPSLYPHRGVQSRFCRAVFRQSSFYRSCKIPICL